MSDANGKMFSLKVMINKEKNTILFAEADSHFTDILLSFLTLPLGRIIKILQKHYGDEAPTIGSLTTLYHSLSNLDSSHFWTADAKQALLNPRSSFDAEYAKLKLNITDSPTAEYFSCRKSKCSNFGGFRSVSLYYDDLSSTFCNFCKNFSMVKESATRRWNRCYAASSDDGLVLSSDNSSFTISDDLQIFPNETGLLRIIEILGITDAHKAEQIQVNFGLSEIMNLLKASLTSPTPLSDVILGKTTQMNYSAMVESQPKVVKEENPNAKNLSLKVILQKSTGKLLYAQAKDDFIEFLFSFFHIPLGGVERLLAGKANFKAVSNLNRSTCDLIDERYFKSAEMKSRVMKLNLVHGSISEDHIFPLVEEPLPDEYDDYVFSSKTFPNDKGSYVKLPRTFQLTDDLIVTPFCNVTILSYLNEMNIPICDVKEVEFEIGLKEGLRILKASLTSTSAITDALLSPISIKQVKREC